LFIKSIAKDILNYTNESFQIYLSFLFET